MNGLGSQNSRDYRPGSGYDIFLRHLHQTINVQDNNFYCCLLCAGHVLQHVDLVDQIQETMLTFHFLEVVAVVQDEKVKTKNILYIYVYMMLYTF